MTILLVIAHGIEPDLYHGVGEDFNSGTTTSSRGVGQYGYPSDPMSDRAKGYLLKGKVKNAVSNWGDFINWYVTPAGLWGEYSYLPDVAMIAGIPGHEYSSKYQDWEQSDMSTYYNDWFLEYGDDLAVWCSEDLYEDWNINSELLVQQDQDAENQGFTLTNRPNGKFIGIVFETYEDRGLVGQRKISLEDLDRINQWTFDFYNYENDNGNSRVCITTPLNGISIDPNLSNAMIGAIYPWALRPALKERQEEFDLYEYGPDGDDWSEDDEYVFYGATTQESWFSRWDPSTNTDWQPSTKAKQNSHATEVNAGELFGNTVFTDSNDSYPLLAHSSYSQTWPKRFDEESGEWLSFWPGWYALNFNEDLEGCDGNRDNDECWEPVPGRFISDNDVYMEFDDRWAHRGNTVNSNNKYEQTGYPLGLKVKSTAHSYGVSFAEDIMFVTVWVYNQSDEMIMPDGTKLNSADGFNYEDLSLGFFMDADVLTHDIFGGISVHTNDDDFMEYVDCKTSSDYYPNGCPVINGKELRVSIAVIGDWDGVSNSAYGYSMNPDIPSMGNDFGLVAVQMLDSPLATDNVDLDQDGITDIYIGEKLKMTDWHWFSWYNRPGVVFSESNSGSYAGSPGVDQARNKEEIQYKIMAGDTTNLSNDEKEWYFHANPSLDQLDPNFNPHFDNVEDLKLTEFFQEDPDGLDCTMKMTSGPFDLAVQDSVPFSFCIIYGQNMEDLLANAEFAQVMYNAKYQGFTSPSIPKLESEVGDQYIKLYWDQLADSSKDVVTGYYDFEGYKIYKSIDNGINWGNESDKIFDNTGIHVGWRPLVQFDLSYEQDFYHCVKTPQIGNCNQIVLSGGENDTHRGMDVSGNDPLAPWFNLGSNTGMPSEVDLDSLSGEECRDFDNDGTIECRYYFIDTDVLNGLEYTYSIVSYDTGLPDSTYLTANPDSWARPNGYQHIESSKGSTILDKNFTTVIPGSQNTGDNCNRVRVIPNPYFGRSTLNETVYNRRISFMDLPEKYTLSIYTISGELVWSQNENHPDAGDGMTFWDLRSVNNQEVSPGLYIYTLNAEKGFGDNRESICNHVGKFAIVR
ncbi:MAG: hypothetical protein CBD21_04995 [bacterium TMED161]|nr:MAG: hypothetical protein CBD21_04995 [bacterium TMED161]|tara:strand:+ start:7456 stop:10689 length:3234 start_codon:yes stop_codon:yes gene_type:complete